MKKKGMFYVFIILCASLGFLFNQPVAAQNRASIWYVDDDAGAGGAGGSWADAFQNVQQALNAAGVGDQIWVAAGVYYPDEGPAQMDDDRTESFLLKDDVALYGGFAGTESSLDDRDWIANTTVLSGDIDQNDIIDPPTGVVMDVDDINGSNAYHVVEASSVGSSAVLDGFVITAGYADTGFSCTGDDCGGGLLINDGSTPTLGSVLFIANYAETSGGGMYIRNGSGSELVELSFQSNEAYSGGGLALQNTDFTLTDGYFYQNSAMRGGGIYAESDDSLETGDLTLIDSTFEYNHANITTTYWGSQTCNGGGGLCYIGDEDLFFDDVTFFRNDTLGYGGGLYLDSLGTALLGDARFEENICDDNGGGLAAVNSTLTINDSEFEDNESTNDGGGLFFEGGALVVSGTYFSYNLGRLGGGLMLSEGSATLDGGAFLENTASTTGGGVFAGWDSSLEITNMSFTDNTAGSGGGIYADVDNGLILNQVIFTRNMSLGNGGGLCNESDAELTDVRFYGNSANYGGGLTNVNSSISIRNALFVGNRASTNGGGMFNSSDDSDEFLLVNATFMMNDAGWGDGLHNEINDNDGAAPNALISNSIFWGSDNQINLWWEFPTVRNCTVEDGLNEGTNILDQDPLFTLNPHPGLDGLWGTDDDDYGDLVPLIDSSVINAGWDADSTQPFDLNGDPRIIGSAVDLGAYEVQQEKEKDFDYLFPLFFN